MWPIWEGSKPIALAAVASVATGSAPARDDWTLEVWDADGGMRTIAHSGDVVTELYRRGAGPAKAGRICSISFRKDSKISNSFALSMA